MKSMILATLLLTACRPHAEQAPTPEPVKMEHRRLTGVNAAWHVACIDGVEYVWALNVGITPKIRRVGDCLSPTFCEVR